MNAFIYKDVMVVYDDDNIIKSYQLLRNDYGYYISDSKTGDKFPTKKKAREQFCEHIDESRRNTNLKIGDKIAFKSKEYIQKFKRFFGNRETTLTLNKEYEITYAPAQGFSFKDDKNRNAFIGNDEVVNIEIIKKGLN